MKNFLLGILFCFALGLNVSGQITQEDYDFIVNELIVDVEGNDEYTTEEIGDWGGKINKGSINCSFYEVKRDGDVIAIAMQYTKIRNGQAAQKMYCLPIKDSNEFWSATVKSIGESIKGTDLNMVNYAMMKFAIENNY